MSPPCALLYPLCGCARGASPPCATCSRAAANAYKQDTFMGARCTCQGMCRSSTECEAPSTHPACADPSCTRCKFRFLNSIGKKCNCKNCKAFPAPPRHRTTSPGYPVMTKAGTDSESRHRTTSPGYPVMTKAGTDSESRHSTEDDSSASDAAEKNANPVADGTKKRPRTDDADADAAPETNLLQVTRRLSLQRHRPPP